MLSILKRFSPLLLALPFAVPGFITVAQAQDGADEVIEEIVTTGSRRAARSATDSAVPIDVISAEDMINQGDTDMNSLLRGAIPSYNVNQQAINDYVDRWQDSVSRRRNRRLGSTITRSGSATPTCAFRGSLQATRSNRPTCMACATNLISDAPAFARRRVIKGFRALHRFVVN